MVFNLNLTCTVGRAFEHLDGDLAPYKLSVIIIINCSGANDSNFAWCAAIHPYIRVTSSIEGHKVV